MKLWRVAALLVLAGPALAADRVPAEILQSALKSSSRFWQRVQAEPPASVSSRDLFAHALLLAEAGQYPERYARLFAVAARMQDRDPHSKTYGNFRWSWKDDAVLDLNAVDFCMQSATLLWLRHQQELPAAERAALRELMTLSITGCLRHRVRSSYTNIAFMNAGNLILLGELFDQPQAAAEGYRRLDQAVLVTWQSGTHEYDSPTYYGVDLADLYIIARFARREAGRQAARAMLELFWSDLAANWFDPAQKLSGSRSRDYDYLRGLGYLDNAMAVAGWLTEGIKQLPADIPLWLADWAPPERVRQQNTTVYPRLVRSSWGPNAADARTNYVLRDVVLGSSNAAYPDMDVPLAVDFAGPRTSVRGYVIADGRHDPYGKKKVPAGGGHDKTIHLHPFFAAAQAKRDALALVAYRDRDVPHDSESLETHWVMPQASDGLWLNGQAVDPTKPFDLLVPPGQAVVLRKGTAAMGVKLPWARQQDGAPAECRLVFDGNTYGAIRLTAVHRQGAAPAGPCRAAAALWVEVAGGLDAAAFAAWHTRFQAAQAAVQVTGKGVALAVQGLDGRAAVGAEEPFNVAGTLEPAPYRGVLEVNGDEVGRPLLDGLPPVVATKAEMARLQPLAVNPAGTRLEAEDGMVTGSMDRADDPQASGAKCVWTPGEPGGKGGGDGAITFVLQVPQAGEYHLWGRVLAPTPDDDSFYVQAQADGRDILPRTDWPVGVHAQWSWVELAAPLKLPAGAVRLMVLCREDGTKLDRLFLTAEPPARPD